MKIFAVFSLEMNAARFYLSGMFCVAHSLRCEMSRQKKKEIRKHAKNAVRVPRAVKAQSPTVSFALTLACDPHHGASVGVCYAGRQVRCPAHALTIRTS